MVVLSGTASRRFLDLMTGMCRKERIGSVWSFGRRMPVASPPMMTNRASKQKAARMACPTFTGSVGRSSAMHEKPRSLRIDGRLTYRSYRVRFLECVDSVSACMVFELGRE